jgi:Rod binding domain-containing protein
MNLPAPLNLKPFDAVRPSVTGSANAVSQNLRPSVLGDVGRYASAAPNQHDQLVDQTRTWVAQTFFGTLLKQMRNSPFKSELFSGGKGGEAFGGLHDQQLAEHMARGAGSKLVNGIVRRIEANAAYRKQRKQAVETTGRGDNRTDSRRQGAANPSDTRSTHAAPALRA